MIVHNALIHSDLILKGKSVNLVLKVAKNVIILHNVLHVIQDFSSLTINVNNNSNNLVLLDIIVLQFHKTNTAMPAHFLVKLVVL